MYTAQISIYQSIYRFVYLFVYLFASLFVHLFIHSFIHSKHNNTKQLIPRNVKTYDILLSLTHHIQTFPYHTVESQEVKYDIS